MNTVEEFFLVNVKKKTAEKIMLEKSRSQNVITLIDKCQHLCLQHKQRLKENNEWLISATYQPYQKGYLVELKGVYSPNYSVNGEEIELDFPFCIDDANMEEKRMLSHILNNQNEVIYSDTLVILAAIL